MKTIKLLLVLFISTIFSSCEFLNVETSIPGMGDSDKPLEVEIPFEQIEEPDSVFITNLNSFSLKDEYNIIISSDSSYNTLKGSGGSYHNGHWTPWITIKLELYNESNHPLCFVFPGGLLFEVNNQEYQHGILISPVIIWVLPHQHRTIYLMLYCINYGKSGSDENVNYKILGITGSPEIKEIVELVKDKDINIDNYILNNDLEKFYNMTDKIQNIIWNLTNFKHKLSKEDKEYLRNIPVKENF